MKNPFKGMLKKENPYPVYLFTVSDYKDDIVATTAFINRLGIEFEMREGNTYFETEFFVKSKMDRDWILEDLRREIGEVKRP